MSTHEDPVERYHKDPKWKAEATHWIRYRHANHPTSRPQFLGSAGFGWDLVLTDEARGNGALVGILLEVPWYSPTFQAYLLTVLRSETPMVDVPVTVTHEIAVHGIIPGSKLPDLDREDRNEAPAFHYHEPPFQFLQVELDDDGQATRIGGVLAQSVCDGQLNPDIHWAEHWAMSVYQARISMGTLQ